MLPALDTPNLHRNLFSVADSQKRGTHGTRLNRTIDYIHRHFAENLNLAQIARIACLSKYHFQRLFKANVGETPNDFIRRIRLEKALHKLVLEEHRSITDIAFDCGFSSSQNFAKAFKAHFGAPPTVIRKNFGWKVGREFAVKNSSDIRHLTTRRFDAPSVSFDNRHLHQERVAYIRHIGPYDAQVIAATAFRLFENLQKYHLVTADSRLTVAVWNNPHVTPGEKCISDICIKIPEWVKSTEAVHIQSLPGGRFAVSRCELEPGDFPIAWGRLIQGELVRSRYRPDGRPIYIHYRGGGPVQQKPWKVNLCLPIELL